MHQLPDDPSEIDTGSRDKENRRKHALERCQTLIEWYEKFKRRQQLAYEISHGAIIVLSGLTPILILWEDVSAPLKALPPALVAVLIGLSGAFQWKENYLRFALASEALQSERVKFLTRTTRAYNATVSDDLAIQNFVSQIERIAIREAAEWRGLMQESVSLENFNGDTADPLRPKPPPTSQPLQLEDKSG